MKRRKAKKLIPYDNLYCYGINKKGNHPSFCPHLIPGNGDESGCRYLGITAESLLNMDTFGILDHCRECNAHTVTPAKIKKRWCKKYGYNWSELKKTWKE